MHAELALKDAAEAVGNITSIQLLIIKERGAICATDLYTLINSEATPPVPRVVFNVALAMLFTAGVIVAKNDLLILVRSH